MEFGHVSSVISSLAFRNALQIAGYFLTCVRINVKMAVTVSDVSNGRVDDGDETPLDYSFEAFSKI